jgi:hypothetical protein
MKRKPKEKQSTSYLIIKTLQAQKKTFKEIEKITKVKSSELSKFSNHKKKIDIKTETKIIKNFEKLNQYDIKNHSKNKALTKIKEYRKAGKTIKQIESLTYLSEYKIQKALKTKPLKTNLKKFNEKVTYVQSKILLDRLSEKKTTKEIQKAVKKYRKSKNLQETLEDEIRAKRRREAAEGEEIEKFDFYTQLKKSKSEK